MDNLIPENNIIRSEDAIEYKVETHEELRYAGFWMRMWAYIIDGIVIFSISGLMISPFTLISSFSSLEFMGIFTGKALMAGIIYYSYFLIMTKILGQTVGKMIFNLKVVSNDGNKPTWSDLFFREIIGRFIYNSLWIMKMFYLVIAFTPKKQGIHDFIGNTTVIHID